MIAEIAPYITILTAIIVAYLTYRNQLRLKTFEMLIERRNSVLVDIEKFIGELYGANFEFVGDEVPVASRKYSREYFHEGLILMHKIKGSNFGSSVDVLNNTFWQIITKPGYNEPTMSKEQFKDWVSRTTNVVSLIYGLAHSELTKELEKMALPWVSRKFKAYKNRKTIQS
ncbi:hypothetical protein [Pseudomonas poae]|uniref:hypothetical protein n=1 Tax=Pseudomonas poae TaxID=200451 RepID=UPI0030D25F7A